MGSGAAVFVVGDFCEGDLGVLGGARRCWLSLRYWSTSMTLRSGGWRGGADGEVVVDGWAFDKGRLGWSAWEVTDRKESCEDLGELGATREDSISSMVVSRRRVLRFSECVRCEVAKM